VWIATALLNWKTPSRRSLLEYISSRGLRALITARQQTRRWNRGDLRLCNMPVRIKEVFDLAGLTPLFKIYDNPVDAVGSF
jgi:anti-sigma B factor antagonist